MEWPILVPDSIDAALVVGFALLALYLRYRSAHDIRAGVLWASMRQVHSPLRVATAAMEA